MNYCNYRNLFLKNGQIKIGDLGSSKSTEAAIKSNKVGHLCYMSPQIFTNSNTYTFKTDIWLVLVYNLILI